MLLIILGIIGTILFALAAAGVPGRISWGWAGAVCFGLIWVINSGGLSLH
jgi:hypothetical protein